MESNTQGRKKHLVEGTVEEIVKGEKVEEAVEAVEEVAKTIVDKVEAGVGAGRNTVKKKEGFFAKLFSAFRK